MSAMQSCSTGAGAHAYTATPNVLAAVAFDLRGMLASLVWRGAAAVMQQQMHRQKAKGSGIAPVQQETTRPMQDHRAKVCSRRGGSPEQQRREAAAVGK